MNAELKDLLSAFLMGQQTLSDCTEWFAGIDWDDPELKPKLRKNLGRLFLLLTEAAEGLRSEQEFARAAAKFVALDRKSPVFAPAWRNTPRIALVSTSTAITVARPISALALLQDPAFSNR